MANSIPICIGAVPSNISVGKHFSIKMFVLILREKDISWIYKNQVRHKYSVYCVYVQFDPRLTTHESDMGLFRCWFLTCLQWDVCRQWSRLGVLSKTDKMQLQPATSNLTQTTASTVKHLPLKLKNAKSKWPDYLLSFLATRNFALMTCIRASAMIKIQFRIFHQLVWTTKLIQPLILLCNVHRIYFNSSWLINTDKQRRWMFGPVSSFKC